LRATDAVPRQYFVKFVGRQPEGIERNIGGALNVLKGQTKPTPNPKTVSMLDRVRELNRNPMMHPEDNLGEDEALLLFDLCKAAIIAMAMEL
jgi:hypothetical protein